MPGNVYHPDLCLMSAVDVTGLTGVAVMARGSNVTLTSTERFEDHISFANNRNRRTGRSLQSELTTNGTGAGVWTVYLDENDRIVVENDAKDFDLTAHADNTAFGFSADGVSATNVSGSLHRITATSDWTRGVVWSKHLELDPADGAAFTVPAKPYIAQSIIQLLRATGIGDADDFDDSGCLSELDNAANDGISERIEWVIDDDGHLVSGWDDAAGLADPAFTAAGDTLRQFFGWSGNEASATLAVRAGTLAYIVGDYPCKGMIVPREPAEMLVRSREESTNAARNRGGSWSVVSHGSYGGWRVSFYVQGPNGEDRVDLVRHFLDDVLPYIRVGEPCTLYLAWGAGSLETRRALRAREVTDTQDAYDLLYTTEDVRATWADGGLRGRLRLYRHGRDSDARTWRWSDRYQADGKVTLVLADRSDAV